LIESEPELRLQPEQLSEFFTFAVEVTDNAGDTMTVPFNAFVGDDSEQESGIAFGAFEVMVAYRLSRGLPHCASSSLRGACVRRHPAFAAAKHSHYCSPRGGTTWRRNGGGLGGSRPGHAGYAAAVPGGLQSR